MRRYSFFLAIVVLVAAGCDIGSDSDSDEESRSATATAPGAGTSEQSSDETGRVYARAELPRLALQPSDAPRGMRYTKAESGPKTFFEVGLILDRDLAQVRRLGLRAVYDVIFDSEGSASRLASRLWLFADSSGAKRWLDKSALDAASFRMQRLSAPRFADGSWAAGGELGGSAVITHAFRAGNVVVVVSLSSQSLMSPSEAAALAAARSAAARVRER